MTTSLKSASELPRPRDDLVTPQARRALLSSFVGYAMDAFDLFVLAFMVRAIAADFDLLPQQAVSLVTATLIGATIGGILFGIVSDYFGRVRVLMSTIVTFAIFTGLCALAQGYWSLLICRTLAGVGLGGEFGIGMALVAEFWPASKRARVSSYVASASFVGILAAAVFTPLLLPVIGWRGMFVLGALPAFVIFLLRRSLHDPDLFIARHAVRGTNTLRLLVKDVTTTKISAGLTFMCGVLNFGYYGVIVWMPNYLASQLGYGLTKTVTWTAVSVLGSFIGVNIFGYLADNFSRRPVFTLYFLGAASSVVIYSQLTSATALLFGGVVLGFFISGTLGGYGALTSELYPTAARATAQNVLFNIGRGIGGFGPVAVGAVVVTYGFKTAIALLSILYLLDIVVLWTLIPAPRVTVLE